VDAGTAAPLTVEGVGIAGIGQVAGPPSGLESEPEPHAVGKPASPASSTTPRRRALGLHRCQSTAERPPAVRLLIAAVRVYAAP
jgi:hypothetical protein